MPADYEVADHGRQRSGYKPDEWQVLSGFTRGLACLVLLVVRAGAIDDGTVDHDDPWWSALLRAALGDKDDPTLCVVEAVDQDVRRTQEGVHVRWLEADGIRRARRAVVVQELQSQRLGLVPTDRLTGVDLGLDVLRLNAIEVDEAEVLGLAPPEAPPLSSRA